MSGRPRRRPAAARRRSADRVQVRESRYGRELVVDGTFASLLVPDREVTGSVWDALAIPLLALPPARRRRALLLGLGGGSAARVMRALAPGCRVVAVEIDSEVVRAAREHFDVEALGLEIRLADARRVLAEDRSHYDLVIDDVFVGYGDSVHKPAWLPRPGLDQAQRRLSPGGVLVSNALDEAPVTIGCLETLLPRGLEIRVEGYDNRILVAGDSLPDARELRSRVATCDLLAGTLPALSFRTRWRRAARRGSAAPRR